MRQERMRLLGSLLGALVAALATGSASANRLSYSHQAFRITWASLTFSGSAGGPPITCAVTLEGSFHARTLTKTADALVAHITSGTVGSCQEGAATILRSSFPWHVQYVSFSGTLPSIGSIRHHLIGAGFQFEPGLGIVCLAQSTQEEPAAGDATREAGGSITSLNANSEPPIPVSGALCPESGRFTGSGEVFVQGSTTQRVTLSLI
jgi:hypothetical protein